MVYLEGNIELAKDILTLLDLVKFNLESKLKIDIITLDNTKCYNNNNNNKDDGDDEDENSVATITGSCWYQ